ncbi:MAG: hydroxymyristoyl-ACP dehydratase [Methylococcaceae bacterium]|nr:hydroxymyristoyl-ACP dehydratase [Methylococcaceae bacterium]
MSEFIQRFCIDSTHPSLAGHFPGNPIVPGVVILDHVRTVLMEWRPWCAIRSLSQAKFLKPLLPGTVFTVKLIQTSSSHIKFECDSADEKLVVGTFTIERMHE